MCELALTKAQSEKRKAQSAKRKAKARFNAPPATPVLPIGIFLSLSVSISSVYSSLCWIIGKQYTLSIRGHSFPRHLLQLQTETTV